MSEASRRSFLAVAGTGAVATAVVASAPSAAAAPSSSPGAEAPPLVAHVRDVASGTIVFYVGRDEVVVRDHDLVRRLTRAARG